MMITRNPGRLTAAVFVLGLAFISTATRLITRRWTARRRLPTPSEPSVPIISWVKARHVSRPFMK